MISKANCRLLHSFTSHGMTPISKDILVNVKRQSRRLANYLRSKAVSKAKPTKNYHAAFKLPIPFYKQASQFTCGPACLMMTMKFFLPSLRLTRGLEFDIWREANLVESYGTSKEGLALGAARRGFDVYTIGRYRPHSFVDAIADKLKSLDYRMLELLYRDTRRKFIALGLRNIDHSVRLTELKDALRKHHVPILLTSTSLFGEKEGLPHWVVLTGYSGNTWLLNNPLARSRNTQINETELENHIGYRGIQCAVLVAGRKNKRSTPE